jgi:hypothetical protein
VQAPAHRARAKYPMFHFEIIMKSSKGILSSRGYIDESQISLRPEIKQSVLKKWLSSKTPTERTKAAVIITNTKNKSFVNDLICALKIENKLYCKIAIQKALISLKDESINQLIPLLGTIGKNQHCMLPSKPFKKDSYPLPRDIVARILIHCGVSVISLIIKQFYELSRDQQLEAIDVLGHLSFYHHNYQALPLLLDLFIQNQNDSIMLWKIIRAFSAFDNDKVKNILQEVINKNNLLPLKWEAQRSLRILIKNDSAK